jgi:hypothetical protein
LILGVGDFVDDFIGRKFLGQAPDGDALEREKCGYPQIINQAEVRVLQDPFGILNDSREVGGKETESVSPLADLQEDFVYAGFSGRHGVCAKAETGAGVRHLPLVEDLQNERTVDEVVIDDHKTTWVGEVGETPEDFGARAVILVAWHNADEGLIGRQPQGTLIGALFARRPARQAEEDAIRLVRLSGKGIQGGAEKVNAAGERGQADE